ncbi:hypothetical protein K503DRAFT_777514 [Rhizopogon vinicolor AM-OR11-026]|uniref:Uncharacterized protein n=1 Tax=Rhizopogon vinicolor AM-OR11-026 TaxID=1314800 RepID=A0A1B7MFY8_9AGAM|nr:hypothetical protein K503DRAFT_777514 [Rhizopogon vinicolor AM-OR11-026]
MRFSFFVIITALTASMPVSACGRHDDLCYENNYCCSSICIPVNSNGKGVGYCE